MNHRSYFDAGAVSIAIARSGRAVRFLGKKEVFDAPVVGQLATAMGGIRVERASGSDEPLQAAAAALEAGELVAMAPAGHDPAGPGVLRPRAQGPLGRCPAAPAHAAPGHPDRRVGDREGLAAIEPAAQRPQRHRPADRADPRRPARRRAQGQVAERRHRADHEGDRQAAAGGGAASGGRRPPTSWRRRTRPATTATRPPNATVVPARTDPALVLGKIRVSV